MGLVLVLRHKLLCMHVFKGLMRCKSICDVKPGLDPYPLLARSWERWWLDFVSFIAHKIVKIEFKKAKCISNRCNDLFKRKKYFGFRCTLKRNAIGKNKTKSKGVLSWFATKFQNDHNSVAPRYCRTFHTNPFLKVWFRYKLLWWVLGLIS